MNVRKPTDYSALFAALDTLVRAELPQMELYREIGRLVCGRPEKGAAVAAAEYLHSAYPGSSGFSPRNLRRMRDFYRVYATAPEAERGHSGNGADAPGQAVVHPGGAPVRVEQSNAGGEDHLHRPSGDGSRLGSGSVLY